jgi:hypothetical protein
MAKYIVSYDLLKAGQDYSKLYSAIANVDKKAARLLESYWVVETSLTCAQVRDYLKDYIDGNDRLVVFASENNWAAWRALSGGVDHLKGSKAA